MPNEQETPEQVEAAFDAALRDPSHPLGNPRADEWTRLQASEAFLERRRKAARDANHPRFEVDGHHVRALPDPTDQPPVAITEETLPKVALPPDVAAEDPVVDAARKVAFYAQVEPPVLQQAITAALHALEAEEPSQEQLDTEGDAITAKAQAKHGPAFPQWLANLQQGRMIAEADPHLRDLLADPRTWNSLEIAEALAQLGAQRDTYYTRKAGKRTLFTI